MISLLVALCLMGLFLWVVERYAPFDDAIKRIIQFVVILFAVVYVARAFGVL